MTNSTVIQAGESVSIVVMHTDGSVSEVKVEADDLGLMNIWINGDPTKPYSVIEAVPDEN